MAFFKVKASYNATKENGKVTKTTREFLVDGILYGEVEKRAMEEMIPFSKDGDIMLVISRYPLKETVFNGGDKYFRIQLIYEILDEKTGNVKEEKYPTLVQANDIAEAQLNLIEHMKGSLADYKFGKVEATKIEEVYFYN